MSTILLTGANGFLGMALLADLSQRHHVVTISRKPLADAPNQTHYTGLFSDPEDLKQLDAHHFDGLVHLAALTGGCSERDGILVNVEGTRAVLQYLIGGGVKKFVIASSCAVPGLQSTQFRPLELPMSDEHPCLDRDGYGLAKYLMEEVTRYLHRQNPDIDIINLRLAAIYPDDAPPTKVTPGKVCQWAAASITMLSRSQAVEVFTKALESPHKAGVRILNAVSRVSWVDGPVANVLRSWWGSDVDLSYFLQPQNQQASLFDTSAIEGELGFVAKA